MVAKSNVIKERGLRILKLGEQATIPSRKVNMAERLRR